MVNAAELCDLFYQALNEGGGYIFGSYGQLWTAEKQANTTNEMAIKYGSKWIGHRVWDCSGLGYWAFKQLGGYVYHGSNTMWNEYVTDRCELLNGKRTDGKAIWRGDPVFRREKTSDGGWNRHHVGYYVGDGIVIEARGTQYGVVSNLDGGKGRGLTGWHETAHWKGVFYDENGGEVVAYPLLKRGSTGTDVKTLQALLNGWGYQLDVDGNFGAKTEAAVRSFQQRMGLKPDGIVGDQTWAALTSAEPDKPDVPDNLDDKFEIRNPVTGQVGYASRSAVTEVFDAFKAAGIR